MKISLGYVVALLGVVGLDNFVPNFRQDILVPLMLFSGALLGISLIRSGFKSSPRNATPYPVKLLAQADTNITPENLNAPVADLDLSKEHINVYSEGNGAMDTFSKNAIALFNQKGELRKKAGRPKGSKNKRKVSADSRKGGKHTVQIKNGVRSLRVAPITCLV